ncbi:enoyl-CoA hydratase/isomerase family protein [Nocardia carnea]|uniref:enoyl-CoA hydratase/isomerase family protein n=1 Tax=Nocardia carnea TaxID=37328 RepID=UPI002457786B|nr:enoyl-CoA hydratase/isomerase family protein [Nocardia carnea]
MNVPSEVNLTVQTHRDYETLALERHGATAVVTLNRPEALNAVNGTMLADLESVFTDLANDESVRAMVLSAAGRAFCAGADVKDPYYNAGPEVQAERVDLGYTAAGLLREMPFPTICAINGACVAIGYSLAALCDLRIAATDARIMLGFAQVGILPDMLASTLLPGFVGPARAVELVLLDDAIDANRAHELGLVTQVVAPENLQQSTLELAQRLSVRSGAATRLSRKALRDLGSQPFDHAAEAEKRIVRERIRSNDLLEGLAAVRERRQPIFTDR